MAQGKLKVKDKRPNLAKGKSKKTEKKPATRRRGNAPIQPKKAQQQETQKLKKMITKTVNKAMEEELRSRVSSGKSVLPTKKSGTKKNQPAA